MVGWLCSGVVVWWGGCVVGWLCSGVVVWWRGVVVWWRGWLCGSVALKLHRVKATIIILLLY